jgi:Bacterial extracellular solute-binding protein
MPQHSARTTYSRWRWVPAMAMLLLLGPLALVLATAYGARPTPADGGVACTTLRVVTARSFAPVLEAVAPGVASGPPCTRLEITVADGRGAAARAASLDADLWIPDDASWRGDPGALALANAPAAEAGAVLATSPLYLVTDPATARRIAKAGGGWRALAGLVTVPRSDVRLVAHAPGGTGDGMLALGAVGEAVWLDNGMDASANALAAAFPRTPHRGRGRTGDSRSTGGGRARDRAGAPLRGFPHGRVHGHRPGRPHGGTALQLAPVRRGGSRPRPDQGIRGPPD